MLIEFNNIFLKKELVVECKFEERIYNFDDILISKFISDFLEYVILLEPIQNDLVAAFKEFTLENLIDILNRFHFIFIYVPFKLIQE